MQLPRGEAGGEVKRGYHGEDGHEGVIAGRGGDEASACELVVRDPEDEQGGVDGEQSPAKRADAQRRQRFVRRQWLAVAAGIGTVGDGAGALVVAETGSVNVGVVAVVVAREAEVFAAEDIERDGFDVAEFVPGDVAVCRATAELRTAQGDKVEVLVARVGKGEVDAVGIGCDQRRVRLAEGVAQVAREGDADRQQQEQGDGEEYEATSIVAAEYSGQEGVKDERGEDEPAVAAPVAVADGTRVAVLDADGIGLHGFSVGWGRREGRNCPLWSRGGNYKQPLAIRLPWRRFCDLHRWFIECVAAQPTRTRGNFASGTACVPAAHTLRTALDTAGLFAS